MKNQLKKIIGIGFLVLLVANIVVFVNGVKLSDEINFYEKEVKSLKQENVTLEKKVYKLDSITYAASLAAELEYAQKPNTIYLDKPGYALNQ